MPGELGNGGKIGLLAGAAVLLLLFLVGVILPFKDTFGLSTLAMGCIVVLLWALVIFAALMNIVGLSDKTQALGLPEGSIRAIIALALVGLFAVLASTVLNGHTVVLRETAVETDLKPIRDQNPTLSLVIKPNPNTNPKTFTVSTPAAPADDFMKQMLTLVGTLMTAIIAFYFGGRTATPSDPSRGPPRLSAVTNSPVTADEEPVMIKLTGSDLNNVKSVRIFNETGGNIEAQGVLSNAGQVVAFATFEPKDRADAIWTVEVKDDIGRAYTLSKGLTVKAGGQTKPEEPATPDPATPPVPVTPPPGPPSPGPTPGPAAPPSNVPPSAPVQPDVRLTMPVGKQALGSAATVAVPITVSGADAANVSALLLTPAEGSPVIVNNLVASVAGSTGKVDLGAGTWTVSATLASGASAPDIGTITVE